MSTSNTTTTRTTKVLLIDDHDLVRKGLRHAFDRDRQFEVVGEAGTAAEAVRLAGALNPDVVITDLRLPDGSGLDITRTPATTSSSARWRRARARSSPRPRRPTRWSPRPGTPRPRPRRSPPPTSPRR
jgi:CheY-like chemotaxis protein